MGCKTGFITTSIQLLRARKKRVPRRRQAIRLQPDLPEAHLALGFYYYYCERDYQAALDEFAIAKRSLPNSAEVYMAIGAIERRQGKWAESTANLEKAASLSPKDAWVLQNLADNYYANRNFETADKTFRSCHRSCAQFIRRRALRRPSLRLIGKEISA